MKNTFYFTLMAFLLLLMSCSTDDDVPKEVKPISQQELYEATSNKFYSYARFSYLKIRQGKWVEADAYPAVGLSLSKWYPRYFWFKHGDVYSDYDQCFQDMPVSDYDRWLDYKASITGDRDNEDFDSVLWLFVQNTMKLSEHNSLTMTIDTYSTDAVNIGYKYVLEEANENELVIRIEFPKKWEGLSAVRVRFEASTDIPKHFLDFDSEQEAISYINAIIEESKL